MSSSCCLPLRYSSTAWLLKRKTAAKFVIGANRRSLIAKTFKRPYKKLQNTLDDCHASYRQTLQRNEVLENQYLALLEAAKQGGGAKAVERHTKQHGKLMVKVRLDRLLDDMDSFFELSPIAGMGMPYGDVASAGVITGVGQIHNRPCMLVVNDGSVKGGTVFPITLTKQQRAQQIAQELHLPCVYLVDSGGAFLPLQADIFIRGGRTFYNEAIMSSMGIPQIAVVNGSCTAGGAYVPTMADEAVIVHRIGTIFLGGPPLVKAATGEIVTAEELGGAALHSGTSGGTDYYSATEDEAYETCRDIIYSLNMPAYDDPTSYDEPLFASDDLKGLDIENTADKAYQIIARLADGSRFHEFKAMYGTELVTGFANVYGLPVGILANNSNSLGQKASEKASHFVQMCDSRDVPLLFLQDLSEPFGCDGVINSNRLKAQAQFMSSVSCADVPKLTIITGKFEGFSSYAMGSKAMGSNLVFNWLSSTFCVQSPQLVAAELLENGLDQEKITTTLSAVTNSVHAAANVWTDGIVLPQNTRKVVGQALKIFNHSSKYLKARCEKNKPKVNLRF